MHPFQVIRRPIITEKAMMLADFDNQYTFEVVMKANKQLIRDAVEEAFDVEVLKVNTMIVAGKPRRWGRRVSHTPAWKKAIVTLAPGDSIELFEGV
ncbi:MAG: 50S ribosomal protein L23 [Anaerolineae bacterium]